jgi:ABC-type nitrate/sulfonate/bicarbonate transport system permease component
MTALEAIVPRASRTAALAWPALLLVAVWQAWIVLANVPAIVAPAPLAVAGELAREPLLYAHAAIATFGVALCGLVLGTLLGCALAVAIWLTPFAAGAMTVPALLVQSTPLIAVLPVLARLLGYGEQTVIAAATLITFLPTFVLVGSGLRALPAGAAGVFAALGAKRRAQLLLLAIPAAVPSVLVAVRIAAANSILAALIAEYMIGQSGLGRLFADAQSQFLTSRSWAASLVATVLSVAAYAAARKLDRIGRRFSV